MTNKRNIQERVDRRLSGLTASPERQARIRAAIHEERQATQPMKRKTSFVPVFVLIAVLLMASLAIAETLNLFNFFGERDARYAAVAPQAQLTWAPPVSIDADELGSVTAAIDSAYFDGLTLNLAFRIDQGIRCEPFTPDEGQLDQMTVGSAMPVVIEPGMPGSDVLAAYDHALESGTPFGYRKRSIYPSDHTLTDDGVDIPPYAADTVYTEAGALCELREFETPLPAELADRDELCVTIRLYQSETLVWFDGTQTYTQTSRSDAGTLTAVIPKAADSTRTLVGSGMIGGAACQVKAVVSPMAAVITLTSDAPFSGFLAAPPDGVDPSDTWGDTFALDENGLAYRPQQGFSVDDRTEVTIAYLGVGALPETLTYHIYTTWEGEGAPDLAEEPIILTIAE